MIIATVFAVALACSSCSGPTTMQGTTTSTSTAVQGAAATSSTQPAPVPPAEGQRLHGQTAVHGSDLAYTFAFEATVSGSVSLHAPASGPGHIIWAAQASGTATITNMAANQPLQVPREFVECAYNQDICPSIYGYWPANSPICTAMLRNDISSSTLILGRPTDYRVFKPPSGKWCVVKYARGAGTTTTSVDGGGSISMGWTPVTVEATVPDQAQGAALTADLAAGPKAWAVSTPASAGETTPASPAKCVGNRVLLWSSTPMVCGQGG